MAADSSPRSDLRANLLLVAGSTLVALLILAAIEGALRLTGVGEPAASRTSQLKYQQLVLPSLVEGERGDGTRVWAPADGRVPYQWIRREKPEDGLRVFAFGGSATAGLGYSPNVAYPRILARMLEAAYPGRPIEVMNLGIVALSSTQVRVLVQDVCERYAPDILIVYSGNNEFLEIHARRYFEKHASTLTRSLDFARRSNLFRLIDRAVRGTPQNPSLADQDLSRDTLRLTQRQIIQDIELAPAEVEEVIARYEANLEAIADTAITAGTRLLLMTVASNWEWRGREDLPGDWLETLLGAPAPPGRETYRRARAALDAALATTKPRERSELLFRRAVAASRLGDGESAVGDYRAAMNEDPHLRRALDDANERLRRVARRRKLPVFDTVEILARHSEHGAVGFDVFYDYVHFTPRGAVLAAAEVFDALAELGWLPEGPGGEAHESVRSWLALVETEGAPDPLARDRWTGFAFDRSLLADRDLWKYDRGLAALDARIEAEPRDALARAHRGNARAFRIDGAADAASDYRAALALRPDLGEIRENLERLEREGRL